MMAEDMVWPQEDDMLPLGHEGEELLNSDIKGCF